MLSDFESAQSNITYMLHRLLTRQVVKFNCNKDNKELGKQLGIKVRPGC
jgi:hypothetical protein